MANMTDSDNRNLSFLVKTEYSVLVQILLTQKIPSGDKAASLSPFCACVTGILSVCVHARARKWCV